MTEPTDKLCTQSFTSASGCLHFEARPFHDHQYRQIVDELAELIAALVAMRRTILADAGEPDSRTVQFTGSNGVTLEVR